MAESAENTSKFPMTRWSLVLAAGQAGDEANHEALSELLQRYTPALKKYLLLSRRIRPQDIEDVLQGFFMDKMITRQLLGKADRNRGKFRNLVIRSLDNYCVALHRQATAVRRGSGKTTALASDAATVLPTPDATDSFDVVWARQIVMEAVSRFKAACTKDGRADLQMILEERVLGPILNAYPAPSYESISAKCGFKSPKQATNALITAKARFVQALSSVVMEYVRDGQELEQEINELMTILGRSRAD